MAEDVMLQEAVEAIRQGQRIRARDLLTRLLRTNQNNVQYWLYMSSVVDTTREQIYCLQSALKAEPNNAQARQGLVLLGALAPEAKITPKAVTPRKWDVPVQEIEELTGLRAVWANPVVRIGFFSLLSLVLVGLIGMGLYLGGIGLRRVAAVIPTNTAGPSPTYTLTPTALNETATTPTTRPSPTGIPPLWMSLKATYTPTPLYVNTPHPANEAFQIAQRAQARGDLTSALSNYRQAQQMSPDAPDIAYIIAEMLRQQGQYKDAVAAYTQALAISPDFAPAYVGRALARREVSARDDILNDLDTAIEKQPDYGEAYLMRAEYHLRTEDYEAALADLEMAEELLPGSPLVYLYRAQVLLAQGENEAALVAARKANRLDATLLIGYRVLAQAADANGEYREALKAIGIFLRYEQKDAQAWAIQAQGLFLSGQYSQTLEAVNQALALNRNLPDAYLVRGRTLLELGDGQAAVNDLFRVRETYPQDFSINLDFGRALLVANRLGDALGQIKRALDLATDDSEKAAALYWRAQTLERIGNIPSALLDWQAMLDLPEDTMPAEWREMAEAHLAATVTPPPPTPTITPSPRPGQATPTPTRAPTRTPRPSATPNN